MKISLQKASQFTAIWFQLTENEREILFKQKINFCKIYF